MQFLKDSLTLYSFKNNFSKVKSDFLRVEEEKDPVEPSHAGKGEEPVEGRVCVPRKAIWHVVKQDLTNMPWNFVDDSVVPFGIANVTFLEIFLLIGERGPCVRSVGHIQPVCNSSKLEVLDNLHGVRLRRLINAVTPSIVLSSLVSVNSDSLCGSFTTATAGPGLVVIVLNPILNVRGEGA